MKLTLLLLALAYFVPQAYSDPLLPLDSGRPQRDGNCWAYGTAHLLESRLQTRDGISAMVNIEKSYRYWLIFDRLLNSFHRKQVDLGDGSGEGILDIGGFSADFWNIFEKHGFEFFKVEAASVKPGIRYPSGSAYHHYFHPNPNADGLIHPDQVVAAEKELVSASFTEEEAVKFIFSRLNSAFQITDAFSDQTLWLEHSRISSKASFQKILGSDNASPTKKFVLLSSSLFTGANHQWFKYDSDRFDGFSILDKTELLSLVRQSLTRGWPTTFESVDHVMTAIGFKQVKKGSVSEYYYAISDSSGAYADRGISWLSETDVLKWFTDATVFYDVLADLIPAPSSKLKPHSVHLNRKH